MYDCYEVSVETPMGAYLNVVTTAVNEAEARANVCKMLNSWVAPSERHTVGNRVAEASCRRVDIVTHHNVPSIKLTGPATAMKAREQVARASAAMVRSLPTKPTTPGKD